MFVSYAYAITGKECSQKKGIIVNTLSGKNCVDGKSIGSVDGLRCPCICCVGEVRLNCKKQDYVELKEICNSGKSIKFKINYNGIKKIKRIKIKLKGKKYVSSIVYKMPFFQFWRKTDYEIDLKDFQKNKEYAEVTSMRIVFDEAPLDKCLFDTKFPKIFKCK